MIATRQSLREKSAADLMTSTVVQVPKEMSLPAAAHLLAQAEVSGAPVVDEEGRCIGVISTTDFLHFTEGPRRPAKACLESVSAWQILDAVNPPKDQVADWMTQDPVMVPPSTGVAEVARLMLDAHIHRVIVVNDKNHPIGVVSSTDILAAVASAGASDPSDSRWSGP